MSFGFGQGFGASSSPFGTTSPSPFGQSAPAPAFGQTSSPFGATSTTGVFGQPQQQAQPAFGSAAPAFGASQPAFGAAAPAFGAASTPAFGSTSFGAKPAGFGFGATASAPSAFGAASAPAFGAASASAFGAAPSPFGATGGFGAASTPAFGAASTPAFGQASTGGFGAAGGFGAQPAAGGFGAPAGGSRGSRVAPWRKTQETDTSSTGTRSTVYYNSISCMPEYAGKSVEEIRWEDYEDGVKGGGPGTSSPGSTGGLFGQQQAASPSPFGQPAASPSPFGAPASTPAFGATSTPAFGAPQTTPSFGGFGAASTPAFGGLSSPAFGGFSAASTPAFGAPASAPAFGATTSTPAFGGFGAASTPAFGTASSSAFGAPASAPAFGGFGATTTPAFGAASAPAFGAPTSAPAFGGFGAASTPAFGAASAPAFGAPTSTPSFSFSGASTPAFGAPSATPAFGAAGSTPGMFGAASTPAFGSAGGGGSLFGSTGQKPATGGFSFTPTSTPAFGATAAPAFGATPGGGGGLFGASTTPAFGATGGGLFGVQTSTPAFSFSTQPTGGQLALAPAAGAQMQAPGVATSPYGTLPEAPRVTPLPEYRVGLTQRMLAPPSGGPPRPIALITPRSLTPHGGGKIRPRRAASASRMSRSPAEFFAAAAAGGGGLGMSPSPSAAGTTPGSMAGGTPSSGNIFVPRDNPRKLFIREPLPSTESSGGVSVSPATGGGGGNGAGGATPARSLYTPGSGMRRSPNGRGFSADLANGGGAAGGEHGAGAGAGGSRDLSDAQISSLLPMLHRPEYYTEPSLTQLAAMAREDPSSLREVANFTVGRRGVGAVRWLDPVDVTSLDIDAIVDLARGSVEVYLEGGTKPEVGQGLNRPAEVTMLKVFKVDKTTGKPTQDPEVVERFTRKLKKVAAEQAARFVSYDGSSGTWKFEVEHFSRYGLLGEESDEEGEERYLDEEEERNQEEEEGGKEKDFLKGNDRTAKNANASRPFTPGSDSDDVEGVGLGVRRRSDDDVAQKKKKGGIMKTPTEAVVAGMEQDEADSMDEGETGVFNIEEEEEGREQGGGGGGFAAAVPRSLQVSLPQRLDLDPGDLIRIRQGLYPSGGGHGTAGGGYSGEPSSTMGRHRRMEALAGAQDQQGLLPTPGTAEQSHHQQQQYPRQLAVRNAWRTGARPSLRPPAGATWPSKRPLASSSQPSLPALPSTPSPMSPSRATGVASPCPIKAQSAGKDLERCLPDSGLFLGSSFRIGWAPNGVLAGHIGGGSAAKVALRRMVVGSGTVRDPSAEAHREKVRRRLEAQLRVHYDASLPDNAIMQASTSGGREGRPAAPRWRLRCERSGGALRELTQKYIQLCNDQAAEVLGPEYALERTILRHQAGTWELIHVLFSSLPAEERTDMDQEEAALEADEVMHLDGGNGLISTATAKLGSANRKLVAMQRRAELSRWLRDRSRSSVEAAVRAAPAGPPGVPHRLTALLSGHQVAAATATAAAAGDVRLATLLAAGGIASDTWRQQLASQLAVWRDASFDAHIDDSLRTVYKLLAGELGPLLTTLDLDWRRALGLCLWYGFAPTKALHEVVAAYTDLAGDSAAPGPVPLYWERYNISQHSGEEHPEDVDFLLLQLFASSFEGGANDDNEMNNGGYAGTSVLPRLLRPSGITPDPLDYSLPWHMLCVLRSINAVEEKEDQEEGGKIDRRYSSMVENASSSLSSSSAAAAASAAHMGFIAQLEAVGEMSHWAVYVALHIPNSDAREDVVRELLARHCPEWDEDAEVASFLLDALQVPREWVAEARALYARYRNDAVAEVAELAEGGDWGAAHDALCERVAPGWLLSGGAAASNLSDALNEMEPHAEEINQGASGARAWQRGGGLYSAFLFLSEVYASLLSDMHEGGEGVTLSYDERMQACGELADRLNDAAAALAVVDRASSSSVGGVAGNAGTLPLRRAALAKMAQELAKWVMTDAQGEGAVPGPSHAVLAAGLRILRYGSASSAIQVGAVSLSEALA